MAAATHSTEKIVNDSNSSTSIEQLIEELDAATMTIGTFKP